MQTNLDFQSSSVDFTSLESVVFYGGFGPINPDRVYVDQENRLVAFFSREKCSELKNYLLDAAKCFYSNNKVLLFGNGNLFEDIMKSECLALGPYLYYQYLDKNFSLSVLECLALGPYYTVTKVLMAVNERAKNVKENMYRRSFSCNLSNAISKSRYENYTSNEIEGCFLGIVVGFGRDGNVVESTYCTMNLNYAFQPPNSLQEIIQMLISIENNFRNGNIGRSIMTRNLLTGFRLK